VKKAVILAAFAAAAALVVAVAPAGARAGWTLTLSATPNPVAQNGYVTLGGTLTGNEGPVSEADVLIIEFQTPDCNDEGIGALEETTDGEGDYSTGPLLADVPPGHYYFQAFYNDAAASSCVDLVVTDHSQKATDPPQVDGIYLCYSKFQTTPGVWPASEAAALVGQGYWEPTAVDGNVDGGVNVGSYHLECNVTPKGDGYVGDGGQWYGPAYAATAAQQLGYYAH